MRNKVNIERLLKTLDYTFKTPQLLQVALTHRSCGSPNNERFEFLGDSILNLVITEELFERFPSASEGKLSRLRAQLVRGDTLADIALELDLGENLLLGDGERKSGGFRRPSILADTVEAIIGAIYLDSSLEQAQVFVRHLYHERLEGVSLSVTSKDAKTRLQEWLQARKKPLPEYQVINAEGQGHDQVFTVQCLVSYKNLETVSNATNRKDAEKQAALLMLSQLGVESND